MIDWIEWSGVGTLSAAQERLMDVRLRDGTHRYGISVSSWRWWHEGAPGDIMAYRIIEPKSDADGWIKWNGGECPVSSIPHPLSREPRPASMRPWPSAT